MKSDGKQKQNVNTFVTITNTQEYHFRLLEMSKLNGNASLIASWEEG